MQPLLTVEDVATALNISKDCVYDLVSTGRLLHIRISAKGNTRYLLRFREKDVEEYVKSNEFIEAYVEPSVDSTKSETPTTDSLSRSVRGQINSALRSEKDWSDTLTARLGYTQAQLRDYLQKKMQPWMTFQNRGLYDIRTWRDDDQSTWVWQIDHKKPISIFQFSDYEDEEFKQCWALENLQPISAKMNHLKKDKVYIESGEIWMCREKNEAVKVISTEPKLVDDPAELTFHFILDKEPIQLELADFLERFYPICDSELAYSLEFEQ